jgi:hypothetical protein
MAKIKFFDKEKVAGFLGESLEFTAKVVDDFDLFKHDGLLSAIPLGKLVSFVGKNIVTIKDKDRAFQKAFSLAYFTTFGNALKRYNMDLECEEDDLKELKSEVFKEFKAEEFDIDHFYANIIVQFCKKKYSLFLSRSDAAESNINKVINYVGDYLELNFYDILEKFPDTYTNYSKFIKSKTYELSKQLARKNRFYNDLKNEFHAPLFHDETGMSLSDTYIEPGFRVHEYCFTDDYQKQKRDKHENKGFIEPAYYKKSVHQVVYDILKGNNPIKDLKCGGAHVIFILGYPGQGKSSFCRKTLNDIISEKIVGDTPL